MEYEDFVLQIGEDDGKGYRVHVIRSPFGEGKGRLRLQTEPGRIAERLAEMRPGSHRDAMGDGGDRDVKRRAPEQSQIVRQTGGELFRALFNRQVGSLFDRSIGGLGSEKGLRIKIKIDPSEASLAPLVGLPWEWLFQEESREFLGLSRRRSVVRYLDVPRPSQPVRLRGPLRILVAMSGPVDLEPLDLARERELIESALGTEHEVELEVLEHATLGSIREAMRRRPRHVFHFMGHGGFDRSAGVGVLYFESPDGRAVGVRGEDFASQLKDFETLGLVFLNACNTAKSDGSIEPFAGVGSALVLGGLPAVLAMQIPISDFAAIEFSRALYTELARGTPLDEAMVEGRQAICFADPSSVEWGTPVLFLRVPNGNVFDREEPASPTELLPPPVAPMGAGWKHRMVSVGLILGLAISGTVLYDDMFPSDEVLDDSGQEVSVDQEDTTGQKHGGAEQETKAQGDSPQDDLENGESEGSEESQSEEARRVELAPKNLHSAKQDPPTKEQALPPPEEKAPPPRQVATDPPVQSTQTESGPESSSKVESEPPITFAFDAWSIGSDETMIPTTADGFQGKITKLEMRPGGQLRCHVSFFNGSECVNDFETQRAAI